MSEKIVQLNEEVIKGQIKELVRGSVEETLNELLEAEAEKLTQAARYERNEQRQGYRSGHYSRNLTTTSGDVTLKVPKLKGISFETAIIERYRRRESSVEEALIEMYLAGVSVRRVEDITETLWGSKVSPSTISELNKKAYVHIEDWRNRPLQSGRYPYVYVDGLYLRRNWGGEFENVAILVAIAVNEDGYREVLGAAEGMKEDKASWVSFFQWLRGRGLDGVKLVVGDKCLGMLEAVGEVFPEAKYQRCTVHFYRNVFSVTPRSKVKLVAKMLKAIHAQESKKAAREKATAVVEELRFMKLAVLPQDTNTVHDDFVNKLAVEDTSVDIMNLDATYMAEFASADWILDLSEYFDESVRAEYLSGSIDQMTYNGKLIAMPYLTNASVLFYRQDVIDELGVDVPTTYQGWIDLAEQAVGVNGVEYVSLFQAAQSEALVCNWCEFIWSNGGNVLDENGNPVANSENNIQATNIMLDLIENYAPDGITTYAETESEQVFLNSVYTSDMV